MRIRTEYSTGLAYGKLEDVFARLLEMECEYMPISDRYSTFGWIEWSELCEKHNKKPIFGVELGISNNPSDKRPNISYWSFFAIDSIKVINDLYALATSQIGGLLTYKQANNVRDCIIICDNKTRLNLTSPDSALVSLSPSTPIGYYRESRKLGFQFVQSSDNLFCRAENREEYRVMLGWQAFSGTYNQFIETVPEWDKQLSSFVDNQDRIDAVSNRASLELMCRASLIKARLPKIDAPMSLLDMCLAGMVKLGVPLEEPYKSRLYHELNVIAGKHFEDYFYIVAELMQWARERMIVAPGRGSSAGSLVCYLLGITSIDPIKYNLLFERFLDITRPDFPDIDMDFDDNRRPMVFAHLEELYGKDRVGKVANVTRFKPKTIISTAGTSLRIPVWLCNKAAEELHEYSTPDARALTPFEASFQLGEYSKRLLNEYPEISLVFKAEEHAKNFSVHAAGAVITDGPISNYIAIDNRNGTVNADKDTAEKLGLLKLDILSVSQLSVFARTLELIGETPTNDFLEQIPLDDEEAFEIINSRKFSGIFQMGNALIRLFKQFRVNKLEDLVAVTSIARPGPLMSGGAQRWVDRRIGLRTIEYAHPCLEPYLNTTYGELVYQEQLMKIALEVGGMSIEDVSKLRRAVGKSKGAEALRPYGDKFKLGAANFGFVGETVDKFWNDLCGFGAYSFNRSHAVSYAILQYYCCWFKTFYPVEFGAASLDSETNPEDQIKLLRELHAEGIAYVPMDAEISVDRWTIKSDNGKKILVGPLTAIRGIGPVKLQQIIEARRTGAALPPGLKKALDEAITPIDSLTPVTTAVARVIGDLKAVNIVSSPTPISHIDKGDQGQFLIIGRLVGLKKKDRNDEESLARRKGQVARGKAIALNLTIRDDSGADILAIIDPSDYDSAAPAIMERGGVDKAIYAIKGDVPTNFRMISIKHIRFLCNIDDGLRPMTEDWFGPQPSTTPKEDFFAVPKESENGTEASKTQ